jgi:hypothetical protein
LVQNTGTNFKEKIGLEKKDFDITDDFNEMKILRVYLARVLVVFLGMFCVYRIAAGSITSGSFG